MYVALFTLCCSLGLSGVSAVRFEEFIGYPFGVANGYNAFPRGDDQVRGVTIPIPFNYFGQTYNFANVSDSNGVPLLLDAEASGCCSCNGCIL